MAKQVDESELRRLVQDEAMRLPDLNIVVSGIAGRFPKADSVDEFEENLLRGVDMINDQDSSRFTCGLWGLPPRAGRLKDLSRFDGEFFGFSVEEANYIDFQLRILYEVVYESILDAGLNPTSLRGSKTGVFFGLHCNEFENAMADDPAFRTNGYYSQYAVKIAQYFDFRGLNVTFDAACASGFVGLHNAVQALADGLIEQAVVCSSNIPIHPTGSFIFLQMQMLSPTGFSRFLDSRADGYVKSEACVSVLLQRKHLALRNYCSILATMTSVDGFKPEGITFPSARSQEFLIRATKEMASVSTNHIEYLEAHGTGTPAGDPQEARAISSVYFPTLSATLTQPSQQSPEERTIGPLLVGSVKTNMGHSEAASGLCALTKVALMLENELIYRGLHYEQPNNNIEALAEGRLKFVDETMDLHAKIVPLSCYGFGGSNVHAIVRANDRPAIEHSEVEYLVDPFPRLIVMFGRNKTLVNSFFDRMLDSNSRATRNCLTDDFLYLLDSLSSGKIDRLMGHRGYLIVDRSAPDSRELTRSVKRCQLARLHLDRLADMGRPKHLQECAARTCNLILPGLGCQWPAMAAGLRRFEPFWGTINRLALVLEPFKAELDLVSLLTDPQDTKLNSLVGKFVAIVACQVALINIVRDQLKVNDLCHFVGHSLGEISCAYAGRLFDERETIMVAYNMGKTLDENKHLIAGQMVAIPMSEQEALDTISTYKTVRISCINGPQSVTLSGSAEEMDQLCAALEASKPSTSFKLLDSNSVALHNETIMGDNIRTLLEQNLLKVLLPGSDYNMERSEWISSSESAAKGQANASYFASSMCKQVNFFKALERLPDDCIALELGPSGIFEPQLIQIESAERNEQKFHYVSLMKCQMKPENQVLGLLRSMGELYQIGATFDLNNFYHGNKFQLPVRRQTPSLSSLFKWDHQHSLFVPRYPIQFSKSSAKCEMPVDIVQDRDKYIADHCIEGRVLYPATGYLFLIWRVFSFTKRQIYDACFHDVEHELVPIEFHNVRLLRAVILGNRLTQIYIHYEEGTGRFEIKEGGSVVVEGYARSPLDKPNGLLYDHVREGMQQESADIELKLNSEDIYKQFRVSGYDYGEKFRNIQAASYDGRYCKVKYNGHFVALTDSILQSIFLAISQYAPSGGLFLPTRFDYVRFQPQIILDKIHKAKMVFDLADGSLNTKAKRDIMTKIMQRESGQAQDDCMEREESSQLDAETSPGEPEPSLECIFETFCDPITGIIVTDGIEMRGIKATPAPRRADNSEVLLESYQFCKDFEDPIEDESLTRFSQLCRPYVQVCDSMSVVLLRNLFSQSFVNGILQDFCSSLISQEEIDSYVESNLRSTRKDGADYDINKNGNLTLLSVLHQLNGLTSLKSARDIINESRSHLMRDLIQSTFVSERSIRPLIELVIENSCLRRMKLKVIEINYEDGLMRDPLIQMMQRIDPTMSIDFSLAHPDLDRLKAKKLLLTNSNQQVKTYHLRQLQSLFGDNQLRELDLIVFKDISCYSLSKQVDGLASVLSILNKAVRVGGFVMVLIRQKLTLAERVLQALSELDTSELGGRGLREEDLVDAKLAAVTSKIRQANEILGSRFELMLEEANNNRMLYLAKKGDSNGCTLLLFKRVAVPSDGQQADSASWRTQLEVSGLDEPVCCQRRVLLRVEHQSEASIGGWLEELKGLFGKRRPERELEEGSVEQERGEEEEQAQVWLCSVATKQNPVSGLIGMMQALRKELGSARLRCHFDCYTFKDVDEPVSVADIEASEKFQMSLRRDLIWNCVDSSGNFGSFRHFTINDQLSHQKQSCSSNTSETLNLVQGAYVNNAIRGDLSSFAWFEAPFKYLEGSERENLVRVAYSALNFRDIMLASGRLPLDAIPLRLAQSDCLLGLEFSGFDLRGNRVMGMVFGRGIASHVLCPKSSSLLVELPDWLGLKEAATIPVVYATAIMALIYRGRMQAGESVLIHAGSGGVGQAAIRLAAHFGLEVYTTVGSDEKRKFLLEEFANCLSEDHIFSSRNCEFEGKIMEMTGGRGVDLVLNSLADEKLQASIRCLADGGRFLEIGKYDMSMDARLELLNLGHNKTFHGILLDKMFDTEDLSDSFKNQLRCVLGTLKDGLAQGYVKPIKFSLFKRNQIEEAFRFMATGKHIGKILIEIDSSTGGPLDPLAGVPIACVPRFQLSPRKSYIVTGGLGGFGLELTKWLVSQGAKHILLTSRSGLKTGYQAATLRRLELSSGAKLLVVDGKMADTTKETGVEQLCLAALNLSPDRQLGGIFHLAMILRDNLLENMSTEDFISVCEPKVSTCQHLDSVTRRMGLQLDYFVAFSSVTSGKGNAGQANYAYANSCLERICELRRRDGEHGLAIQWGAIGDVGVAYENLGGNNVVIGGTIPQRIPSCLATLSKLLCSPFSICLSVLPVSRGSDGMGEKGDLVEAIMHVLGIKDPSKVSEQATLGELGLDSLMAVEIRQYIEREYELTLNIQEIRSLTIARIRDISENEKPTSNSANRAEEAAGAESNLVEAQNYGNQSKSKSRSTVKNLPIAQVNGEVGAILDKEMISSFIPKLELPSSDYCRLNFKHLAKIQEGGRKTNGLSNGNSCAAKPSGRPIFFIPPIHGEFDKLELVCSNIKRPCIGLNWTRKLGRVRSIEEAVEVYLKLLQRFDWANEFGVPASGDGSASKGERVVDLVGYSYGATIAFELMLAIHRLQRRLARRLENGLKATIHHGASLRAGRLVLLDGSPKQIELGSQYLGNLTRRKPLKLADKVDELLMVYIVAHTRKRNIDYLELQRSLAATDFEHKIEFASQRLATILGLPGRGARKAQCEEDESEDKVTQIGHAMEAFCRRYELMSNYRAKGSLPADCTLIRAEKIYLSNQEESYNEDLELSSVTRGKVNLFVMKGDHETFLTNNHREIGEIITKYCSSS